MIKQGSTIFLRAVIVLLGVGALALLLWEPQLEGVNANATWYEVYLDPFIALVYLGAVPFFIALYQAFTVLGSVDRNTIFSKDAVRAMRTIKFCALAIIGFVVAEEAVILLNHGNDDAAGALSVGIIITFGSIVIATAAAMFERVLQSAADIKSENDLTV